MGLDSGVDRGICPPITSIDDIERVELALAILNSEAFMWLMVGSNHQESQLATLRPAYQRYVELGGGWGKAKSVRTNKGKIYDSDT